MKTNLIYLAQPCDFGSADSNTVLGVEGSLAGMGFSSYNPKSAFIVNGKPNRAINQVNEAAMDASAGAVAFLPRGVTSIGVPAEIGHLLARFTPVLIVSDVTESWVLAGWADNPSAKVVGFDTDSIEAGLDWLRDRIRSLAALPGLIGPGSIVFQSVETGATLPTRGYDTDAGYDLYTSSDTVIPARGFADVPCGVSVDLPEGTWGQVTGRSSTLRKRRLLVAQGVIDEEYTGPLFAGCENLTDQDIVVLAGERVAQLILHDAPGQQYTPTWGEVRAKARGGNGFGSTGR